ncbi:MAG TPA: GNAT family N-acetyltransferase [Lachnospiraceae bacterium]|nr:GNAT family N-acetyltransferase [Lachnospiraceae bacterium]
MVRLCTKNDYEQMVDLAYRKNNDPTHFSAFFPRRRDSIERELTFGLESFDHILIGNFQDGTLNGLLSFYIDKDKNNTDCAGPFIDGDFLPVAKAMLDYGKSMLSSSMRYTFYFGRMNQECIEFMKINDACDQGNEYQLILKRDSYIKLSSTIHVDVLPAEYSKNFIQLHDMIFPGIYISGTEIIQSIGKDRKVFCIIEDEKLLGYSVLKIYENSKSSTAEIIAVHEEYRHQGYGRLLLNRVIEEALSDSSIETVDLIVDKINRNALSLYYAVGFELKEEMCNYQVRL